MKFEVKIISTSIDKGALYVTASIPRRKYDSQPKIKIFDKDIIEMIQKEFEVKGVIKSRVISNSKRGNHSQQATWIFKVVEKVDKTIKTLNEKDIKQPEKPKTTNEEPDPVVTPVEKPAPARARRKKSTTGSIRGRMSKIAKDKKQTT